MRAETRVCSKCGIMWKGTISYNCTICGGKLSLVYARGRIYESRDAKKYAINKKEEDYHLDDIYNNEA